MAAPAGVPSVRHSSAPWSASMAQKKATLPTAATVLAVPAPSPGQSCDWLRRMVLISFVPAAVPSLAHSAIEASVNEPSPVGARK